MSVVVHSARWFWFGELAVSFAWQIGWVVLFVASLLFALRARRRAMVSALLGCAMIATETRLWIGPSTLHGSGAVLELVSANVLQSNRHDAEVARALRETQADVIAVLELSKPLRAVLDHELEAWPHRAYSPEGPWHSSIWALGVYSKRPLNDVRLIAIRECYAPAIECSVSCGEREMQLRVVHLPRPGEQWRVDARNDGLDQLAETLAWQRNSVLLGDLNITSNSPHFAPLLERAGLRDSRAGFGRQPSWWLRSLGTPLGIAIDHVLVGADVRVNEREIFPIPFSDHAGVRIRLSLSPAPSSAP